MEHHGTQYQPPDDSVLESLIRDKHGAPTIRGEDDSRTADHGACGSILAVQQLLPVPSPDADDSP